MVRANPAPAAGVNLSVRLVTSVWPPAACCHKHMHQPKDRSTDHAGGRQLEVFVLCRLLPAHVREVVCLPTVAILVPA